MGELEVVGKIDEKEAEEEKQTTRAERRTTTKKGGGEWGRGQRLNRMVRRR